MSILGYEEQLKDEKEQCIHLSIIWHKICTFADHGFRWMHHHHFLSYNQSTYIQEMLYCVGAAVAVGYMVLNVDVFITCILHCLSLHSESYCTCT